MVDEDGPLCPAKEEKASPPEKGIVYHQERGKNIERKAACREPVIALRPTQLSEPLMRDKSLNKITSGQALTHSAYVIKLFKMNS